MGMLSHLLLGKKYMKFATKLLSSVAWTERVGHCWTSVIDYFTKNNVSEHLIKMGKYIKEGWIYLARKNNVLIEIIKLKQYQHLDLNMELQRKIIYSFTNLML